MIKNKAFQKMNDKLMDVYQAFYSFSLNIPFRQESIDWFSSEEGYKIHKKFTLEYQDNILNNLDRKDVLRGYLLNMYVNGISEHYCVMRELRETYLEAKMGIKDEMFVRLCNHMQGIKLIKDDIQNFVLLNGKYSITEIDKEGFNISGEYYKEFEIEKISSIEGAETMIKLGNEPVKESNNSIKTRKLIDENFEELAKNGWEYAFRVEKDYNDFANLLTTFFECKEYSLPSNIDLKKGCKTRIASTLGRIHSALSKSGISLVKDIEFLNLVRTLNHFKNSTDVELYKDLTRFGKD